MLPGLSWMFWACVDTVEAAIYDPEQRWKVECPYCDHVFEARSPTMALMRESIHVELADDDGPHPTRDEVSEEYWNDDPNVEPTLIAGETHHDLEAVE